MASAKSVTVVTLLAAVIVVCHGQSVGVANNIYDSLAPLGCSQFLAILNKCRDSMKNLFRQQATWTVFVPNDTAFNVLPPSKRNEIINMNQEQSENYVNSFTLSTKALLTTQFQENRPEQSNSPLRTKLFLMSRVRRQGDSASGVAGPTEYYVNGAMVVRANVPAGTALIHVIDRVLDTPSGFSVFAYISLSSQPDTAFFNELLNHLREVEYYNQIVQPLNQYERITAFIPTKEALGRIPSERLRELQGNPVLMNEFIKMHIIPYQVVYTSFVYHNEGVNSMGKGQIIFRKSTGRETVFVNSGGVTAEIVQGNITCTNGAIHFIDTLMGYTYNSAKDEIELNPITQNFETILSQARTELRDVFTSSIGVTAFIPINQALNSIPSYNNLLTNQSLINTIVELSMLELGQEFELTRVNGDYYSRVTLTSRHFRQPISVYSQGNETWIESGYVKARVVRPDVKVTNGFIHLIDAVPGAPTRDVPNTIFCEDWLIKSSLQLYVTGLNDYMRDPRLQSVAACTTSGGVRSSANVYDAFDDLYYPITSEQSTQRPCGNCAFTVFIPNGTAIEFFENTPFGREVQANVQLWQYVLKRHITRQLIYLDKIAVGVERSFTSLNGEEVRYRRATDRYAYVYFAGRQASILHSDLAGTNGVIHIIDQVLYVSEDLYRSSASSRTVLPSVPTRHDVTCGHNDLSFSIDLSQFQLRPQTATLSDTRCRLNLNGSRLTGRTALNACGTTIRFSNDTVIFSNTILLSDLANSSGSTSFTIPIECHYNRISDFRLTYLPIVSQILFKEIGDGEFDFRIQQFTDASFAAAISASSYPLQVMPSQEIFIQLSLEDVSQNMSVGMEVVSCLASPHSSPLMANQVHQNLIVDGCPANTDVRVIEEKHDSSVSGKPGDYFRFSFKALTFSGVSNSTTGLRYILCRVQLCDDNPGQATSCSTRPRQCPSPSAVHRRRRAASESANLQLSTGPLLLLGQRDSEDSAFHTDSPTAVIVLGALTGLATLVAVTAVVAWLRGLRKRRQLGYPILSPDQTEQLGLTATG